MQVGNKVGEKRISILIFELPRAVKSFGSQLEVERDGLLVRICCPSSYTWLRLDNFVQLL